MATAAALKALRKKHGLGEFSKGRKKKRCKAPRCGKYTYRRRHKTRGKSSFRSVHGPLPRPAGSFQHTIPSWSSPGTVSPILPIPLSMSPGVSLDMTAGRTETTQDVLYGYRQDGSGRPIYQRPDGSFYTG